MSDEHAAANEPRFISENGQAGRIAALAEPVIEALGFRLVRVTVSNRDGGTLQIMAERADGQIDVNELAKISRDLSPLLDAHDIISDRYFMEVSSPGIDRPLVRPGDFKKWVGYEAKIKLTQAIEGQKRFRGFIEGFENNEILLRAPVGTSKTEEILGFAPALIEEAKLVMTDALIKAAMAGKAAQSPDTDIEDTGIEDTKIEE
ncbi:MAG: ribosome maturation factor RimP [Hyphomicrobiaceae bacterium]|nr:ribosome maturation factor RimP [Hyphomicrobiaceae bacterium]